MRFECFKIALGFLLVEFLDLNVSGRFCFEIG